MNRTFNTLMSRNVDVTKDETRVVKTSADIIKEARESIATDKPENYKSGSVRTVNTLRPFTPLDGQRILFGKKTRTARPPSTFSLRYLQFENISKPSVETNVLKLPAVGYKPFSSKLRSSNSLEHLPEDDELTIERKTYAPRNAYSSPIEQSYKETATDEIDFIVRQSSVYRKLQPKHPGQLRNLRVPNLNDLLTGVDESLTNHALVAKFDAIYECLNREYFARGKRVPSNVKLDVIKTLYRFVESKDVFVLAAIARNVLSLRVTGSNLSGVSKLIFKISRDDKNDEIFLTKNILDLFIESLGTANPLEDCEALIYGYGAIRFLTMNGRVTEEMFKLGALELTVLHVKIINNSRLENTPLTEPTHHVLFQLTGALRNLASNEENFEKFIYSGAVAQICVSMNLFVNDLDIMSNVARILSVISVDYYCCKEIMEHAYVLDVIVSVLEKYPGRQDMIVRLGYTLGNLVAKFDEARLKFYNIKHATRNLLNIIDIYMKKEKKDRNKCGNRPSATVNEMGSSGSAEDVIIKMVRVLANIAINPDIGTELVDKHASKLIETFRKLLARKPRDDSYELTMSVLSTLNNLSFYYAGDDCPSLFNDRECGLCEEFLDILQYPNVECVTETVLVLGNLSRSRVTRDFIVTHGIFETLVNFLYKNDVDLIKATIGVLINLMTEPLVRETFARAETTSCVLDVFTKFGASDWSLSTYICQLLWNYSVSNETGGFNDKEINALLTLLMDYLDEERIFGITEDARDISDVLASDEYVLWEEFATVGTNLLERVEFLLDGRSFRVR